MFEVFAFPETRHCPSCINAKRFLSMKGEDYHVKTVDDQNVVNELKSRLKLEKFTLPQIWHNGQYIGGFSELKKYIKEGS